MNTRIDVHELVKHMMVERFGAMPKLDWRAYFGEFCKAHGFPVFSATYGRLLFPDGWSYHATDYSGPEWPPPHDGLEAAQLVREYWTLRKALANEHLVECEERLRGMSQLQAGRSAPVTMRITRHDPDTGERVNESIPFDFDGLRRHIEEIREDILLCEEELM